MVRFQEICKAVTGTENFNTRKSNVKDKSRWRVKYQFTSIFFSPVFFFNFLLCKIFSVFIPICNPFHLSCFITLLKGKWLKEINVKDCDDYIRFQNLHVFSRMLFSFTEINLEYNGTGWIYYSIYPHHYLIHYPQWWQ